MQNTLPCLHSFMQTPTSSRQLRTSQISIELCSLRDIITHSLVVPPRNFGRLENRAVSSSLARPIHLRRSSIYADSPDAAFFSQSVKSETYLNLRSSLDKDGRIISVMSEGRLRGSMHRIQSNEPVQRVWKCENHGKALSWVRFKKSRLGG